MKITIGNAHETLGTLELQGDEIIATGEVDKLKKIIKYLANKGLSSKEILHEIANNLKGYFWTHES